MVIFNQVSRENYKVSYVNFSYPTIEGDSKKLKTLEVNAVA
jgi:hypothetical protein